MIVTRAHHLAVVGQLEQRLADKDAQLARLQSEHDQFRRLFVEAMGKNWNDAPIASIPLQSRTLEPQAVVDFELISARWSAGEKAMYDCWYRDVGKDKDEPERFWVEMYGGSSPLEVLQ